MYSKFSLLLFMLPSLSFKISPAVHEQFPCVIKSCVEKLGEYLYPVDRCDCEVYKGVMCYVVYKVNECT